MTVTITDNDDPRVEVSFEQATYTVAESDDTTTADVQENQVTIKVKLSADPERTVVIPVTKAPQGGATAADYSGVPGNVTFNAGETEKTFIFSAKADTVNDDGESVKLGFGSALPARVTAGSVNQSVVSITDDDLPSITVSFEQEAYTVAEGNSVTVKVKLSADPERSVTIPISRLPQGTTSPSDYSGVPLNLTFASEETEKDITFVATQDTHDDDGESVKLEFGSNLPTGISEGTTNETVVSITDDDVPAVTVSFEQSTYTVAEGSTTTVKVKLNADPERTVTIPVNKAPQGGATSADYSGVPLNVVFNSGDTEKTITFSATADSVDDDGESVKLTFGTLPTGVSEGITNETVVSITDDDVPSVTVSFEQAAYTVTESDDSSTTDVQENQVTIKVKLSADPERTVVIPITRAPQDGASAADYSGVPGNLTFNSEDTEKTITFMATHDTVDDDGESVKLGFGTMPTGVTPSGATETTISITDDDVPRVTVNFGAATYSVAEGSAITVTVKLSADPERIVDVPILVTPIDGASLDDFSGVPENVTLNSGDTEKTFSFSATQDTEDDDGERVILTFGDLPARVTSTGPSQAVVSITDDDLPADVNVSFGQVAYTVLESDDPSTTDEQENQVTIKVKLSEDPERTITVPITKMEQDGATSADYSGVPENITFNSGDTEKTITFQATHDTVDDDGESVKLGFGTNLPSGVSAGTPSETLVSITDDDHPTVNIRFERATYTAPEGGTQDIRIVLNADPERTLTFTITKTNQGGASNSDYSVPGSVTFHSGDTEMTIAFSATADSDDDDGESVKLGFGTMPTGAFAANPTEATVNITDDDHPATVTVSYAAATYTAPEGGSAQVKVTLSPAPERQVVVLINRANQDGASNSDYSGVPTSLTFGATDTEKTFTFAATDDSDNDDGESVKLTFGTLPTGLSEGTNNEAVVSITDSDVPTVTVGFKESTYTVAEGNNVTVTLELSADPERTVAVLVNKTNQGGATSVDYSGVPGTVTFASGETEKEFTFTAASDNLDDDGESVKLTFRTLPAGVNPGTKDQTVISITDDDYPAAVTVSFEHSTYAVPESDNPSTTEVQENRVSVKVKLDQDPERTVTIPVNKTNQDGATSADYSGVPNNLTFNSGQTEKTITFQATADSVNDDGESVKLTFGTLPTGISEGTTNETVVSITDDDVPSVTVSFEQATYTVAEGNSVSIKVKLSADPERSVTVPISRSPQGATSPGDYSGVPSNVTFISGDIEETITFTATQDTYDDDGDSVKLAFGSNLPDGISEGTIDETLVSITDDDVPSVTVNFASATYTVAEGNSVTVKVTVNAAPERQITVPITKAPQNGASEADYSGVPPNVTFNANDTEKTFSFTAATDSVDDDGESVKLTFGTMPTRVSEGTTNETVVSITDDDTDGVTVSETALTIQEGNTDRYTVVLDTEPAGNVTVINLRPCRNRRLVWTKPPSPSPTRTGSTAQTVTITALEDNDSQDETDVTLSHAVSSTADTDYNGISAGSVRVSITDNDTAVVTVSKTSLTIQEGNTDSYTVVLNTQPTGNVTVTIGGAGADVSVNSTTLTFTSITWGTSQTVTVTAVNDNIDEDNETSTLTHAVASTTDTDYNGVTTGSVTVTVTDDDTARVSVNPTSLTLDEGDDDTYTVTLGSKPTHSVTVTVNDPTDNTDVTADPASLTFTNGNWSTAQTVTVSAAQDAGSNDETATVTHTVTSTDAKYSGISVDDVDVSVTDNDDPNLVLSRSSASIEENAGEDFTVKLATQPSAQVTVAISSGDTGAVSVSTDSLTFTTGNWATTQSVTVTALEDNDTSDETVTVTATASSSDQDYQGKRATLNVSVTDNDTKGLVINESSLDVV